VGTLIEEMYYPNDARQKFKEKVSVRAAVYSEHIATTISKCYYIDNIMIMILTNDTTLNHLPILNHLYSNA